MLCNRISSYTAVLVLLIANSIAVGQDAPPANETKEAAQSALGKAIAEDQAREAAGEKPKKTVVDEYLDNYVGPEDKARVAFVAPPDSQRLSKTSSLWIDAKKKRVYIDGYIAMREGALEMFACPVGTKEHESIVAVLAKSREVHAGLLAIGAKPGSPVRFLPEFSPPKGQTIRVWVCWRDEKDKFHFIDGRRWVEKVGLEGKHMQAEWVFAGSGFWKDPADGREYYRADGGDLVCVSNFTTAMLDVNISSSAEAGELRYLPFVDRIPTRFTPVRVVMAPVGKEKPAVPTERILSKNKDAKGEKKQSDSNSN